MTTDTTKTSDRPQRRLKGGQATVSYACHGCRQRFTSGLRETSPWCLDCRPLTEQVCPSCGYVEARGRWCSNCLSKTGLADWRKPIRKAP